MELWCSESVDELQPVASQAVLDGLPALPDINLLADARVLERLLSCETRCTPPSAQFTFATIQQEITPDMRKQLASWMLEVNKLSLGLSSSSCCPSSLFIILSLLY